MPRYLDPKSDEAAYTPAELEIYDKYWDAISIEKTLVSEAREEGALKAKQEFARKLLAKKFSLEEIAALTELPLEELSLD